MYLHFVFLVCTIIFMIPVRALYLRAERKARVEYTIHRCCHVGTYLPTSTFYAVKYYYIKYLPMVR